MLIRLLEKLAKGAAASRRTAHNDDDDEDNEAEDDDDSDVDGYDMDEDIGMLGVQPSQSKVDRTTLQRLAMPLFASALTHTRAATSMRLWDMDIVRVSSLWVSTTLRSPCHNLQSRLRRRFLLEL